MVLAASAARSAPVGEPAAAVPLRSGHGPVVDVMVNGRGPYPFLLDTGSSHTSIDAGLAARLGATRVARTLVATSAGDGWAAVLRLDSMALGPLVAIDLLAIELPGGWSGGEQLMGVVGRDLLGDRAFTLDYGRRKLRWPTDAELDEPGAAVLTLDTRGRVWLGRADAGGRPVDLVPDSRADDTVVFDRGQWRHLRRLAGTSAIRSVTGERRVVRGTLWTLNLDRMAGRDADTVVSDVRAV